MVEKWKQIPVAPDYEISSLANIRRITAPLRNRDYGNPKGSVLPKGYAYVVLRTADGGKKTFQIHRLVMLAFAGASDLQVNHKNGIKHDNRLTNLEYVSGHANRAHARSVLDAYPKGVAHPNAKLTEADVRTVLRLSAQGLNDGTIAKVVGCTAANVWMIRHRKAWTHIK